MRWTPGGKSSDIDDERGATGGFGGGGLRVGLGGAVVLLVLSLVFHQNFFALLGGGGGAPAPQTGQAAPVASTPAEDREVQFVSFVLDDAQKTWTDIFQQAGQQYRHARLTLFRDGIQSACGSAETAMGPFYCPGDEHVYLDLGFFDELRNRFGADGDFAQAYVIAHELGHHVQKLLGTEAKVRDAQERSPEDANRLSVALELQADCYAGVWGHSTQQRQILEQGDLEAGLNAAAAVGDDRIQRMSGRGVHPESFTHGTSAQRAQWFKRGFDGGRPEDCNTFGS
jgi:predicted metalloprotease